MMNNKEKRTAMILAIQAIEEYLNIHKDVLKKLEASPNTSQYALLNAYKDELINKVYKGELYEQ